MNVTTTDIETALRISPLFYEAVLEPQKWPMVLQHLRAAFSSDAAQMIYGDFSALSPVVSYSVGIPKALHQKWLQYDHGPQNDPRGAVAYQYPNMPLSCRDLVPAEIFHKSNIYRDIFEPAGFDHTLATQIPFEWQNWGLSFGLIRKKGRPEWDERDTDRLHLYLPHFRQAALVAGRLHFAEHFNTTFAAAFDHMPLATLIVNGRGILQYANAAARTLLESKRGFQMVNDRVLPMATEHERTFLQAVEQCAIHQHEDDGNSENVQMVVPVEGAQASLYTTVAPVRAALSPSLMPISNPYYAIVFINDPEQIYENRVEHLQRLFGLSEIEAKVMQAYGQGQTIAEIAAQMDRSVETIRSHLKSLRDKSNLRTQVDITKFVGSLPV